MTASSPVEGLFPFVLKSRILLIGRETLARSKSKLHFVLITEDITEKSREEILAGFAHYPVVQHYTMADLEKFFQAGGATVLVSNKSTLAQSVNAGLKQNRLNRPVTEKKSATPAGEGEAAKPAPPEV